MPGNFRPRSARRARIVHLSAEYLPFARAGGLAEAVAGLAGHQARSGAAVAVVVPLYQAVRESQAALTPVGPPFAILHGAREEVGRLWRLDGRDGGPMVLFVEHAAFFDRPGIYGDDGLDYPDNARRFAFFVEAALARLPDFAATPLVLHAHDWHTALAPLLVRARRAEPFFRNVATVLTAHNAAFQGAFPAPVTADALGPLPAALWQSLDWQGSTNWLKAGLESADVSTTVSPTHREELRTPEGGFGLHERFAELGDRLIGVLNGIDPEAWHPGTDPALPAAFTTEQLLGKQACKSALQAAFGLERASRTPLVVMSARLVWQKGIDLVLPVLARLWDDAQFLVIGRGEPRYERALQDLARARPDRVAVPLAFDDLLERRALAGADLLLMPSLYEPCGLTQLRAQRYGAPPVARRVGGLSDTIRDGETGFLFDAYAPEALEAALRRAFAAYEAPEAWTAMMRRGMVQTFDWARSSAEYARVYAMARARVLALRARPAGGASARAASGRRPVPIAADGKSVAC